MKEKTKTCGICGIELSEGNHTEAWGGQELRVFDRNAYKAPLKP